MSDYKYGLSVIKGTDLLVSMGMFIDASPKVFFFQGNGVEPYLIKEAYFTQGTKTVSITCNGKNSFYVPAKGRWSDSVSFAGFNLPEILFYNYRIEGYVVTYNDEPYIDTEVVNPYVGPPETRIPQNEEYAIIYNPDDDITVLDDNCTSTSGWVYDPTDTDNGTFTISSGLKLDVGAKLYVHIYKLLDIPTYCNEYDLQFTTNMSVVGEDDSLRVKILEFDLLLRFNGTGVFITVDETAVNLGDVVVAAQDQTWRIAGIKHEDGKWDINLYCDNVFVNSVADVFHYGSYSTPPSDALYFGAEEGVVYVSGISLICSTPLSQLPWTDDFTADNIVSTDVGTGYPVSFDDFNKIWKQNIPAELSYTVSSDVLRIYGTGEKAFYVLKMFNSYSGNFVFEFSLKITAMAAAVEIPDSIWQNCLLLQFSDSDTTTAGIVITNNRIYHADGNGVSSTYFDCAISSTQFQTVRVECNTDFTYIYVDDEYLGSFPSLSASPANTVLGIMATAEAAKAFDVSFERITINGIDYTSDGIDTEVGHVVGTITVIDECVITVGSTLTIDTVVYTLVDMLTGAENEILIGNTSDETATNIAITLNNTYGALITATVVDNVVTMDYLSSTLITWSTTSSCLTLGTLTIYYEYTYETTPATLPSLESLGYTVSDGFGGVLPKLESAGTVTSAAFAIGNTYLPALKASGKSLQAAIDSEATPTEMLALLECDNGWMEYYAGLITFGESNDDTVLTLAKYVATSLTYTADVGDEWKDPQQTIIDGYGDCEDGAFLLYSLIVNSGISSSRVRIYFGYYSGVGHAWVAYLRESDNNWVTIDWTTGTLWLLVSSLDQLAKTYYDDYYVYTEALAYISCGVYAALSTIDDYIASIVGMRAELEYPSYIIEAEMDSHSSGEVDYPTYEVDGYTGATTESNEPYDNIDYPDYTVEATGYGNSIGHNAALTYPDYTMTGSVTSGDMLYTEEDNLDYPDYAVTGTVYVVASMDGAITYPSIIINSYISVAQVDLAEWDGTEPNTAIRLNTVNFAATRYSGFHFNSMCSFLGEIICANSSGIVRHTGSNDKGVDIDAYFQLPSADFSTHKAKSYRKVYLEGYTEGELTVTTVVDDKYGSELNIASLGTIEENQYVFERQKDDRGNLIGLRVANNDGKDFIINTIYATMVVSSSLPNGYTGLGRAKFEYPDYTVSGSAS